MMAKYSKPVITENHAITSKYFCVPFFPMLKNVPYFPVPVFPVRFFLVPFIPVPFFPVPFFPTFISDWLGEISGGADSRKGVG